jgi:hypothetical protein
MPPKPEVEFYVPTSTPVTTFPFCDSETRWPQDIALVVLTGPIKAQAHNRAISVTEIIAITREDLSAARLWT